MHEEPAAVPPIAAVGDRPTRVRLCPLDPIASDQQARLVETTHPGAGVAVVALRDIERRNMVTAALADQLRQAFDCIVQDSASRVIVVQGHDRWFCTGGSPEVLDAIRSGRASFADDPVFRLLLDCPLPTIAAMQGHALGGGLAFGLCADIIVLAEQAFYAGNFMEHGFTPGVGATYLFPHKFGAALGSEMLFTARRYRGSELRERGVSMKVVSKDQVIPEAMALAESLAARARRQLELLKERLASDVRREMSRAVEDELAMHRAIFAHRLPDREAP